MSQHKKKKLKKEKDFGPERCFREVEKVGVFVCPKGLGRNFERPYCQPPGGIVYNFLNLCILALRNIFHFVNTDKTF